MPSAASHLRLARIRRFQSLRSVRVEFGQVTVIVGANSVGKTAVLRALQAAFLNWSGGRFVTEGEDDCSVELEMADGSTVVWSKPRKGGARYEVESGADLQRTRETITRAHGEMPPELQALLGVREVVVEGQKLRLQFEMGDGFLLDETGGQAAKVLAHVSRLDVLLRAQAAERWDLTAERQHAADATSAADAIDEELAGQPDYDALAGRYRELDGRRAGLRAEVDRCQQDADAGRKLVALRAVDAKWRAVDALQRLTAAEETHVALHYDATAFNRLCGAQAALEEHEQAIVGKHQELERLEADLHALLETIEACPVCGTPKAKWPMTEPA